MAKYLRVPFKVRKISQTSFGITLPNIIVDVLDLTEEDSFYISASGNEIKFLRSGAMND